MVVITVIFIILLVLNFIYDIAYVSTKNRYIKIMKKQNELLWVMLQESNNISIELVKQNLKKDGGQTNESILHQ